MHCAALCSIKTTLDPSVRTQHVAIPQNGGIRREFSNLIIEDHDHCGFARSMFIHIYVRIRSLCINDITHGHDHISCMIQEALGPAAAVSRPQPLINGSS
jgi:hypothetical protein